MWYLLRQISELAVESLNRSTNKLEDWDNAEGDRREESI